MHVQCVTLTLETTVQDPSVIKRQRIKYLFTSNSCAQLVRSVCNFLTNAKEGGIRSKKYICILLKCLIK